MVIRTGRDCSGRLGLRSAIHRACVTIRWVISRKTIVVEAVRGGLISVEDACWRYSLTLEEFSEWKAVVERRAFDRRRSLPKRDSRVQQSDTAGPAHHS